MPPTLSYQDSCHPSVPVHGLGISQIISYGFLFYAFAQLKIPLAERLGVHAGDVLVGVTISLLVNGVLAPLVGYWFDRLGALRVLATGLVIGSISLIYLTWCTSFPMFIGAMVILGVGFSMCNYEAAFSAAVQIDETASRRNISIITFYGGVASSLTWLMIAPLMHYFGFVMTMYVLAFMQLVMAVWVVIMSRQTKHHHPERGTMPMEPFRWTELTRAEKIALITLALSSAFEYLSFGAVALMLIQWYQEVFGVAGLAVLLASIYGPFQVIGRVLEMRFGAKHDARYTAIIAFVMVPTAVILIQYPSIILVAIGMA
ncbi:MAG: MFS transporter, partial [Candidatus Puniceispirillales bacterium]